MIHYLEARSDYLSMGEYLEGWGRDLAGRVSIRHYDDLPKWRTMPAGTYLLADLDHLSPAGRRLVGEVWDQLTRAGPKVRVLNSPKTTLLRFELLEELHRRGLNSFRAVRAEGDFRGLRYPVFVRNEHRHEGALTPLLRTPEEVEASLGWAIARGHRLNDLLVVEFCDTADRDGFFRKYAAFRVGAEVIPRSLAYGRKWMLKHAGTEFSAPMLQEERAYVLENPHERELSRIFSVAGVDYGRIDYAVKEDKIQTWEINLNPTIRVWPRGQRRSVPAELQPLRKEAKEHFTRRFQAALEAIDVGGEGQPPIPIRFRPESLRALGKMTRVERRSRWGRKIRKRLRPLEPVLRRVAEIVSPIVVKVARRVG